jgi:phosphatidylinositol alpha 1,6-mannosyltransferase
MSQKELRVAIFTGNYNHIRDGVSLTLNRLVNFLLSKDIPVVVFGPTVEEPAIEHAGDFVAVPSIPMPGRPEYRVTIGFPEEVQQKLKAFNPTLIHIATPDLLGFRAMRYAQANGIQIVASYHTHFTSYLKYYSMDMLEVLGWKYLSWFYSQCHHIYVPTPSMIDELKEKGITNGLKIWARGVDTQLFSPGRRDLNWRKSIGIQDQEIAVTFVSRLVWEKDLQTVVDTLKKVASKNSNIKPIIVGEGPARKELEQLIPNGYFTGYLTGEELARAYASSDIFFFPSDTETFGNVTLEAMASGVPAVVADATGSKSLITHGENGFLGTPKQTKEFASLILNLADDVGLRARMSEETFKRAQSYSWKIINSGLLELYNEALKQPVPELKF